MSRGLSPAARAYLRKLRNPYATDQIEEQSAEFAHVAEPASNNSSLATSGEAGEKERSDVWASQDPYATLAEEPPRRVSRTSRKTLGPTCSRAEFRAGCKRVLRHYSLAPERGLREEHAAFIARNEDRPPEIRYELLRELQRFDLSDIQGIQPRLHREKDVLTEEKLNAIERKVLGE